MHILFISGYFMTQIELKKVLLELKWTKAELARRVGLDPHTISRWSEVPGPVVAYLDLAIKVRGLCDEI